MYPNVEAEMARNRMTKTRLAHQMGMALGTLSLKLAGKSDISFAEAMKIKKLLKVDMPIEKLFEEKEDT